MRQSIKPRYEKFGTSFRRIIYYNGSNRVVSLKLPEQVIEQIDRYYNLLSFRNRSEFLRMIIGAFLYTLEEIEKISPDFSNKGVKITIIASSNGTSVKEVIDLRTSVPQFMYSLFSRFEVSYEVSNS